MTFAKYRSNIKKNVIEGQSHLYIARKRKSLTTLSIKTSNLSKGNTMDVKFENLNKIDDLIMLFNKMSENQGTKKRWLSVRELAIYLDYSSDRIHKLKGSEFIDGVHYHKRSGKLLFDKFKVDEWVLGISDSRIENDVRNTVTHILNNKDL